MMFYKEGIMKSQELIDVLQKAKEAEIVFEVVNYKKPTADGGFYCDRIKLLAISTDEHKTRIEICFEKIVEETLG